MLEQSPTSVTNTETSSQMGASVVMNRAVAAPFLDLLSELSGNYAARELT